VRAPQVGLHGERRRWTRERNDDLLRLMDAGHGDAEIAARLGRTRLGVRLQRNRLERRLGRDGRFSVSDLARVLGRPRGTVANWVERGWMPSERAASKRGRDGNGEYRVTRRGLAAFLADGRYRGFWRVGDIPDGPWRDLAAESRRPAPLLTTREAGARLGYGERAVNERILEGRLRAVRGVRRSWLVPEDALGGAA
jgi:DNA-binding CsgD family transcriptional regulator